MKRSSSPSRKVGKGAKTDAPRGKNPRGRAKRLRKVVTPEIREQIGRRFLEGQSLRQIGAALGLAAQTVDYWIQRELKPLWKADLADLADQEMGRVRHLQRVAWERFAASQQPRTREQLREQLAEGGVDLKLIERVKTSSSTPGEACWLEVIQWCHDWLARVGGLYQRQEERRTEAPLPVVLIEIETHEQGQRVLAYEDWQRRAANGVAAAN